jgi:hypothetical protein
MAQQIEAREIKNMPWGGAVNQGQAIGFRLAFHDGPDETYVCALALLPLLMGNLTQYANMAEAVRVKASPRTPVAAAPYRVTKVPRSGFSPDGKLVSVEFETTHGFPLSIAMSPELAKQTIEFLQREILLAASPRQDNRN